jgi:hypothetical protein
LDLYTQALREDCPFGQTAPTGGGVVLAAGPIPPLSAPGRRRQPNYLPELCPDLLRHLDPRREWEVGYTPLKSE